MKVSIGDVDLMQTGKACQANEMALLISSHNWNHFTRQTLSQGDAWQIGWQVQMKQSMSMSIKCWQG